MGIGKLAGIVLAGELGGDQVGDAVFRRPRVQKTAPVIGHDIQDEQLAPGGALPESIE